MCVRASRRPQTYITSEFQDSVDSVLRNALNGVQTDNYEFPLYTKDGERVEVLLNATTRRDAAGAIVGVVGVGQDITQMKAAQAEEARIADDLTLLIDTANAPIFGIDGNGKVNEWNRKAASITGYSRAEVMGKDLVKVAPRGRTRGPLGPVLERQAARMGGRSLS